MKYTTPEFTITRFSSDRMFATGTCTSSFVSYEKYLVSCIISGSEYIFTSASSGCDSVISSPNESESGTDYKYVYYSGGTYGNVTYSGGWYFCWKGSGTSTPTEDQMNALKSITGLSDAAGWHAGLVSDITMLLTKS